MADGSPEPSLQDWLTRSQRGICLVFADIVGSALLIHGQGTRIYTHVLTAYRSRADQLVRSCDGRLVSREGDEIFAAFLNASDAFGFARAMSDDAGHPLISVRVGLHCGDVSCHEGRLVGRAVPLAARVMDHAGPHEIWISDAVKRALAVEQPVLVEQRQWGRDLCLLDGIPEAQVLWKVLP